MYARFTDSGNLEIFHKNHIVIDGTLTVNPSAAVMRRGGYKPLVMTPEPKLGENEVLAISYRDAGDTIESVYDIIGGSK